MAPNKNERQKAYHEVNGKYIGFAFVDYYDIMTLVRHIRKILPSKSLHTITVKKWL